LNVKNDFANDAIELQSFLAENQTTPQPVLRDYARAALFARQRRNSQAIALYQKVAQSAPQAPLADDASLRQQRCRRILDASRKQSQGMNNF